MTLTITLRLQVRADAPVRNDAPKEWPRPRQTYFDWYKAEDWGAACEAVSRHGDRPVVESPLQMKFPWCDD